MELYLPPVHEMSAALGVEDDEDGGGGRAREGGQREAEPEARGGRAGVHVGHGEAGRGAAVVAPHHARVHAVLPPPRPAVNLSRYLYIYFIYISRYLHIGPHLGRVSAALDRDEEAGGVCGVGLGRRVLHLHLVTHVCRHHRCWIYIMSKILDTKNEYIGWIQHYNTW